MAIATVKWFNLERGFGFVVPETGGADIFVHMDEVVRGGMTRLIEGQKISYEVGRDRRGRPAAVKLRRV